MNFVIQKLKSKHTSLKKCTNWDKLSMYVFWENKRKHFSHPLLSWKSYVTKKLQNLVRFSAPQLISQSDAKNVIDWIPACKIDCHRNQLIGKKPIMCVLGLKLQNLVRVSAPQLISQSDAKNVIGWIRAGKIDCHRNQLIFWQQVHAKRCPGFKTDNFCLDYRMMRARSCLEFFTRCMNTVENSSR